MVTFGEARFGPLADVESACGSEDATTREAALTGPALATEVAMMRAAIQSTTDFLRSLAMKTNDETPVPPVRREANGPLSGQPDRLTAKSKGEFYLRTVIGR